MMAVSENRFGFFFLIACYYAVDNAELITNVSVPILECPPNQFKCQSDLCMDLAKLCDGVFDCPGYQDERHCPKCPKNGFRCSNNICIPETQRCNGINECGDTPVVSDEANCTVHTCPIRDMFVCSDGICLDPGLVCDGNPDCSNDELFEGCECPLPFQVKCHNTGMCVHKNSLCDGKKQCSDGSDEWNCTNILSNATILCIDGSTNCTSSCPEDRPFICLDGEGCLSDSRFCNGLNDCLDGSDEANCTLCPMERPFGCSKSSRCISQDLVCNGQLDCGESEDDDQSDELDCSTDVIFVVSRKYRQCTTTQYVCQGKGLACLNKTQLCDGVFDCPNFDDEKACSTCGKDAYQCPNGNCIPQKVRCNGVVDCSDDPLESDEANCTDYQCPTSHFKCINNGICIPKSLTCDGNKACHDGSDEANCTACPIERPFKCGGENTTRCIPESKRCNGGMSFDCRDGSDEANCTSCPQDRPFRCENGTKRCISITKVCDGKPDCGPGDESDEIGCPTAGDMISPDTLLGPFRPPFIQYPNGRFFCPEDQYTCLGNALKCLDIDKVCDGVFDCPSLDDERGCPDCGPNAFECPNLQCLPLALRCNGQVDCADDPLKSDEINCTDFQCSPTDNFKCLIDGVCINKNLTCDGVKDCQDGSDENDCTVCPKERPFKCGGSEKSRCIAESKHCDGGQDFDCKDGSDETDCLTCPKDRPFRCENGARRCISIRLLCDGKPDCGPNDESDEIICPTVASTRPPQFQLVPAKTAVVVPSGLLKCPSDQYQCNGITLICLNKTKLCDGTFDCPTFDDEKACPKCGQNAFQCSNKQCIPQIFRCNGRNDCPSGDESEEANCHDYQCPSDRSVKCQSDGICIHKSFLCDGITMCKDGTDEANCSTCPDDERTFKCKNDTMCIRKDAVCDGIVDCSDVTDEASCSACPVERPFKCGHNSTRCIPLSKRCDGNLISDCPDRSDEQGCPACPNDRPFQCRIGTSICLPISKVCDGKLDCGLFDPSDELDCSIRNRPIISLGQQGSTCDSNNQFMCRNGQCIDQSKRCDGGLRFDCQDGSDEAGCLTCPEGRPFRCSNGTRRCISREKVCDGNFDCGMAADDRSDEMDCSPCLPMTEFNCPMTGRCISNNARCDGQPDCNDGADELNCSRCSNSAVFCRQEGKCFPAAYRCDGDPDCKDGSDEQNC